MFFKKKPPVQELSLEDRIQQVREGIEDCTKPQTEESAQRIIALLSSINFCDPDAIQDAVTALEKTQGGLNKISSLHANHYRLRIGERPAQQSSPPSYYDKLAPKPARLDLQMYLLPIKARMKTQPKEALRALSSLNHFHYDSEIKILFPEIDLKQTLAKALPQYFNDFSRGLNYAQSNGLNLLVLFDEKLSAGKYQNITRASVEEWTNKLVQNSLNVEALPHLLRGGERQIINTEGLFGGVIEQTSYTFASTPPNRELIDHIQSALNQVDKRKMLGANAPPMEPEFKKMVDDFYVPDQWEIIQSVKKAVNELPPLENPSNPGS